MTLQAVTYYKVICNESGCKAEPDDEYSAWSEADVALEQAIEAGWGTGYGPDGGVHHWCPQHLPTCVPGTHLRDYEDDRCRRCRQWPVEDEK